jgi:hypothetical protein
LLGVALAVVADLGVNPLAKGAGSQAEAAGISSGHPQQWHQQRGGQVDMPLHTTAALSPACCCGA